MKLLKIKTVKLVNCPINDDLVDIWVCVKCVNFRGKKVKEGKKLELIECDHK